MLTETTDKKLRTIGTMLIIASFVFQVFVALIHVGGEATPYGVIDDQGRVYGFSNKVTAGHLGILLSNVTWAGVVEHVHWYALLCLLAHGLGLCFLWRRQVSRTQRIWFFGLQMLFFPLGFHPFTWMAVLSLIASGVSLDGETLNDGLFHPILVQFTWFLVSAIIWLYESHREEVAVKNFIARYS